MIIEKYWVHLGDTLVHGGHDCSRHSIAKKRMSSTTNIIVESMPQWIVRKICSSSPIH